MEMFPALCNTSTQEQSSTEKQNTAKRSSWGPTHSDDSDGVSSKSKKLDQNNTATTKESDSSSGSCRSPSREAVPISLPSTADAPFSSNYADSIGATPSGMFGFFESAVATIGISNSNMKTNSFPAGNTRDIGEIQNQTSFMGITICTPCQPTTCFADEVIAFGGGEVSCLGMEPLTPCDGVASSLEKPFTDKLSPNKSSGVSSIPSERRRRQHQKLSKGRSLSVKSSGAGVKKDKNADKPCPLSSLEFGSTNTLDMERGISELTMRSSYGEAIAKLSENRRMAYYAVGKHRKKDRSRGNRRCYFTGKLILGGAPFYAGSVQQGLRTLVVFCLPSALDLPDVLPPGGDAQQDLSESTNPHVSRARTLYSEQLKLENSILRMQSRESSIGVVPMRHSGPTEQSVGAIRRPRTRSTTGSLSEMSMSIEEEMDPNWGLSSEYLLKVLPEPDDKVMKLMATMYPDQYQTLPIQVRSPHCWKLFVKFCFFSGLPISEGDLHYKVNDEIAIECYGEEIVLSHDIMEAVNGDSADMLRKPNQKTFRYLRKHYNQQSSKLPNQVFDRKSWELVLPEV